MDIQSSRRLSRPTPMASRSLEKSSMSSERTVTHGGISPMKQDTVYDRLFWVHSTDAPSTIVEEPASYIDGLDPQKALPPDSLAQQRPSDGGYIPRPYFEWAQRTLNTLIVAGTLYAFRF